MGLKDDVLAVKKELYEVKEKGFAMEILSDYKKTNKRMFVALVLILCMWFSTIGYLVYILNDIEYTEETIDIQEVETIDGSTIKIGDDVWEKSQ